MHPKSKNKLGGLRGLFKNSTYLNTNHLRERLLKEKIKECKCEICNNIEWLNYLIPLELHHIDGINTNNSLNNLQLLCPNCHAQTDNYRGKNINKTNVHVV